MTLAISARLEGKKIDSNETLRYILHQWRRKFHASYSELQETPLDVILSDLEYIELEQELIEAKRNRMNGSARN